MKHLRTYELFGFGSKKPKTWQDVRIVRIELT